LGPKTTNTKFTKNHEGRDGNSIVVSERTSLSTHLFVPFGASRQA